MKWLDVIIPLLIPIFVYLFIKACILAVGIGVGFLLTWLLPELNLSVAMLIGVIATGMSLYFFGRFLAQKESYRGVPLELDEESQTLIDIIASAPPPANPRHKGRGKPKKRWTID